MYTETHWNGDNLEGKVADVKTISLVKVFLNCKLRLIKTFKKSIQFNLFVIDSDASGSVGVSVPLVLLLLLLCNKVLFNL